MHGGLFLFKAEVAGASVTRLKPKLYQTARILWAVYGFFTLACILFFMAAGMPGFDAVCTSFSTLSSGGFTLHTDSIGFYASPAVEAVAVVFMFLGATNFVVHYWFLTGRFREASKDAEMRTFVIWLAGMSAIVIGSLMLSGMDSPVRNGLFGAVSAATTTGFSTVSDMSVWPPLIHALLLFLMLTGATLGSTSGGLKTARFLVLIKNLRNGMIKAIHPRAVLSVKMGGKAIPDSVVSRIQILFLTFTMVLAVSVLLLCATGISLVDSFSASASCIANCGLSIFSPGVGFHTFSPFAKAVLTVVMWMGRLEIFTALMVLAPSTYRK
jgi:trk system potassium uptake protein TrkH